jgi:ribosomal protein S18 acetylase RimI-like enzyme
LTEATTPLTFRPVRLHDVEPLHQLCFPQQERRWVAELIGRARQIALNGRGIGLVGVDSKDVPHAYGQLTVWVMSAEISDLMVTEALRGRGIGSALIAYLLRVARETHVQRVEIGAEMYNVGALALYRRLGFVESRILDFDNGMRVQYLSQDV